MPISDHPPSIDRLVENLTQAGFYRYMLLGRDWEVAIRHGRYKYLDQLRREEAQASARVTGYLFDAHTNRCYQADAEDLAEGCVDMFLCAVAPFLKRQGVRVADIGQDLTDHGYTVVVNGRWYVIYNYAELVSGQNLWELSTRRAFNMVNTFLGQAGSPERAYLLYGGNDAQAVFLTPTMWSLVIQSGLLSSDETPTLI